MNIVFGKLVGDFNDYFIPNSTVTEGQFKSSVNTQSSVFSSAQCVFESVTDGVIQIIYCLSIHW